MANVQPWWAKPPQIARGREQRLGPGGYYYRQSGPEGRWSATGPGTMGVGRRMGEFNVPRGLKPATGEWARPAPIWGEPMNGQQPQLASMIQQPPPQLGTFGTPAPQQYQPSPQPQQQPKPKYDWQQLQTTTQPTLQPQQQAQTGGLLPGQPLPPTQQFGYAQPYAQQHQPLSRPHSYGQPQWPGGQPRPRRPQFGGLSQYFNY